MSLHDPNYLEHVLKEELARRKVAEPLRYMEVNPAVERYLKAWANPIKSIVIFPASNAIGKSWGTIIGLGWSIWPDLAPDWFRIPWMKKMVQAPIDKSFRICSTPQEVSVLGSLQEGIKALWPQDRYTAENNRKPFPSVFRTDTGWVGDAMSYEQHPDEFEGGTRGIIIYNEPPPKDIRQRCVSRTRMGGMEGFPMTPLANAAWINDDLITRVDDPAIEVVGGEMEEACKEHSRNGHLPHARIQAMMKEMDPDELEARTKGKFLHLAGLILRGFSRQLHVSKERIPTDPLAPCVQVIDPGGFNKPFAVIWAQVVANPMHGLRILREWPDGSQGPEHFFENIRRPELNIEKYASLFDEIERDLKFPKADVHRIMDRRFGANKDLTAGRDLMDRFGDYGYFFNDSYKVAEKNSEIKTGIENIRQYFRVDPLSNIPFLQVSPNCVNLIRAVERWALDPKTFKPKDDVWKNMCDTLRYLASAGLEYFIREPDQVWNADISQGPAWGVHH